MIRRIDWRILIKFFKFELTKYYTCNEFNKVMERLARWKKYRQLACFIEQKVLPFNESRKCICDAARRLNWNCTGIEYDPHIIYEQSLNVFSYIDDILRVVFFISGLKDIRVSFDDLKYLVSEEGFSFLSQIGIYTLYLGEFGTFHAYKLKKLINRNIEDFYGLPYILSYAENELVEGDKLSEYYLKWKSETIDFNYNFEFCESADNSIRCRYDERFAVRFVSDIVELYRFNENKLISEILSKWFARNKSKIYSLYLKVFLENKSFECQNVEEHMVGKIKQTFKDSINQNNIFTFREFSNFMEKEIPELRENRIIFNKEIYINDLFIDIEKSDYIISNIFEVFHRAVHSPPRFIILMGPPGTGKTSFSVLYAGAYYGITGEGSVRDRVDEILRTNDKVFLVRVRPNWHDSSDILGYVDIHGNFRKGLIYDFLKRASGDKENLYFLILDEMNLSHPEHYLSDIISAMESGGYIDIPNTDERIPYPHNLVIIGTVNLDETTKNLSPRLLSRAVTITMRTNWDLISDDVNLDSGKSLKELFRKIDEALSKANLGIGYREFVRAKEFIEGVENDEEKRKLLDAYLKSKIVPRIRGTREIFEFKIDGKPVLDYIIETLNDYGLKDTKEAIEVKKSVLENMGYIE